MAIARRFILRMQRVLIIIIVIIINVNTVKLNLFEHDSQCPVGHLQSDIISILVVCTLGRRPLIEGVTANSYRNETARDVIPVIVLQRTHSTASLHVNTSHHCCRCGGH